MNKYVVLGLLMFYFTGATFADVPQYRIKTQKIVFSDANTRSDDMILQKEINKTPLPATPAYLTAVSKVVTSNLDMSDVGTTPTSFSTFTVELEVDGEIISIVKTQSCGNKKFDSAVEKAIMKTAPFPIDDSGNVPFSIQLSISAKK